MAVWYVEDGPSRWTQNGGRRIELGAPLRQGEVVVTGWGARYHLDSDCSALRSGWAKAYEQGRKPAGLFAVEASVARKYVNWCERCGR